MYIMENIFEFKTENVILDMIFAAYQNRGKNGFDASNIDYFVKFFNTEEYIPSIAIGEKGNLRFKFIKK